MSATQPTYRTGIGSSDLDSITLLGHDLAGELIGKITFGELAYWLITKRRPTPQQRTMFEAVLVSLADHGFTPTAIAARVTFLSAPDSLQGALAAGLLGGGSRFLGVTEDSANFLRRQSVSSTGCRATKQAGTRWQSTSSLEPGPPADSYPVWATRCTSTETRAPRCCSSWRATTICSVHISRCSRPLVARTSRCSSRSLPLNGAGVCGAVLADIDLPLGVIRGVALLARCAGLLGHLAEEIVDPIGNDIYMNVDRNMDYRPPGATDEP